MPLSFFPSLSPFSPLSLSFCDRCIIHNLVLLHLSPVSSFVSFCISQSKTSSINKRTHASTLPYTAIQYYLASAHTYFSISAPCNIDQQHWLSIFHIRPFPLQIFSLSLRLFQPLFIYVHIHLSIASLIHLTPIKILLLCGQTL